MSGAAAALSAECRRLVADSSGIWGLPAIVGWRGNLLLGMVVSVLVGLTLRATLSA
jgi:hypothetical protein